MQTRSIDELSNSLIDVLTELGNIGMGNAATALSQMLNTRVDMNVPSVAFLSHDEATLYLHDMQSVALGVVLHLAGDAQGIILHLLRKPFAKKVINVFFPADLDDINDIDEMSMSVIQEIGNITSAAYVNAIAAMTGMFIDISTPSRCFDMENTIINSDDIKSNKVDGKYLFINNSFFIEEEEIKSNLLFLPETETLEAVFSKLALQEK